MPFDSFANDNSWDGGATVPMDGGSDFDIMEIALRYKWWLTFGMIAGLIVGQLLYIQLGPLYQATGKILVSKTMISPVVENAGEPYAERSEHIALILSPMIARKAVEMHHLDQLASFAGSEDPVDDLITDLKVQRSAGTDRSYTNVLDITFMTKYEQDASKIVEAVIDAYRDYLEESHRENAGHVYELISDAQGKLLKELQTKQAEYLAFRERAPLQWNYAPGADPGPNATTNVHRENLTAIENERRQNLLRRAELTSRQSTIREAIAKGESRDSLAVLIRQFMAANTQPGAAGGAASVDGGTGREVLEAQLVPLLLEEKRLLRDFGPDHPDVRTARQSIRTLVEFYRSSGVTLPEGHFVRPDGTTNDTPETATGVDLVSIYLQSLAQQLTELEHRDVELQRLYEKEAKLTKELAHFQAEDQVYSEDLNRIKTLWESVVRQLNERKLVQDNNGYSLQELAPPKVELVIKRQLKILGAGIVGCMGLVLGMIYLKWMSDTTLRSVAEVRRKLNLPILGGVPTFRHLELDQVDPECPISPALCYYHDPGSSEAEAYRAVRTTLFVSLDSTKPQIIQVTSPEPGDGKTTSISNLAIAMSQSGKRVLLIDADMRRPTVHNVFGCLHNIGLSDVLRGEIQIQNAIQETLVDGLWVLTAGPLPSNPAELLTRKDLPRILNEAAEHFDVVLIDTPPLLAVSDPCIVAQHVDAVLLVVRLIKSTSAVIKRTRELLQTNGMRVVGTIVNGIPPAIGEDYYAYGYVSDVVHNDAAHNDISLDAVESPADKEAHTVTAE